MVRRPDCHLSLTQHTLKYMHKNRGYCKGAIQETKTEEEVKVKVNPPTPVLVKPTKSIDSMT